MPSHSTRPTAAQTASILGPDARHLMRRSMWVRACGPALSFWFNPEIDQGFGLSGTLGVAGFTSGTAYKVGANYPYARLPETFIRQTINLGGETEMVEAGPNQFAGTQTKDR